PGLVGGSPAPLGGGGGRPFPLPFPGGRGGGGPPPPAGGRLFHVSRRYARSRHAKIQASPPLRSSAHEHARGAGGREGKHGNRASPGHQGDRLSPARVDPRGQPRRRDPRRRLLSSITFGRKGADPWDRA